MNLRRSGSECKRGELEDVRKRFRKLALLINMEKVDSEDVQPHVKGAGREGHILRHEENDRIHLQDNDAVRSSPSCCT